MINQLDALTSINTGKQVQGTYKGIEFSGIVIEANRSYSNRPPVSFVVQVSKRVDGLNYEDGNNALFYASDIRKANGTPLEIKKVAWPRTRR